MTDELEAIRVRAEEYPGVDTDSPLIPFLDALRAWDGSGPIPGGPEDLNLWRWYDDAARDRHALLARLDAAEASPRRAAGAEAMTDELMAIRARHVPGRRKEPRWDPKESHCEDDKQAWPCDTARLLALLDAAETRVTALARLIVSYADLTHDVVVQGRGWQEIATEWQKVVDEARTLLAEPSEAAS